MKTSAILSLALLCGSVSGSWGTIPVTLSERIGQLQGKIKQGKFIGHRTGKLEAEADLFAAGDPVIGFPAGFDDPEAPDVSQKRWRGEGSLEEYEVVKDGSIRDLKAMLAKEWQGTGLNPKVDEGADLIAFSAPEDSSALHNTADTSRLGELESKAMKEAGKRFKCFKGRLEFENTEVGYVNERINSVRLRFRRIFKGGIIRGDISYAYIALNSSGETRELRVKWPKFRKTAEDIQSVSLEDATTEATGRLGEIPPISNGQETLNPLKGRLKGMAFAWMPLDNSDKLILTPGLSFIGEVDYEGGQVKRPFIDVPLGMRYLK